MPTEEFELAMMETGTHLATLVRSEEWNVARQIIRMQTQAIQERNPDLWLKTMYFEDDLAKELQRSWFEGYVCRVAPKQAWVELVHVEHSSGSIMARSKFHFEYADFDPVGEERTYTLTFVPAVGEWRIVDFTNTSLRFPRDLVESPRSFVFRSPQRSKSRAWWQQREYVSIAKSSADPLAAQTYARAVPRTVRFREAHPQIESAAILSDLMSLQVSELTAQVFDPDALQLMANLYQASQNRITMRVTRPDRGNTWYSKLHAPWFNFDELLAQRGDQNLVVGNCPSIMSFYFAVLRLGGYGPYDIFQLRLYNHDVLVARIGADVFLLCPDRVLELTPRMLYYTTTITKVFTDQYYWTSLGSTNMGEMVRNGFLELLKEKLPRFEFKHPTTEGNLSSEAYQEPPFPSLRISRDPSRVNALIKKHVMQCSNRYPYSPFTWAKYAHQTLFVTKPETYATCSLQGPLTRATVRQYSTQREFFQAVQGFEFESIFCENDRLMTADQVIRYKTGDIRARALLLFSFIILKQEAEVGFVLFTDQSAYCIVADGKKWRVWDAARCGAVSSPEGKLILAFDDTRSVYPLVKGEAVCESMPVWYRILASL